uniref:Retrotransposon gag domain-containing protein n=1 Tax=Oryza brachyantha TaxID=4533 RepID=J3L083_ORYBR
MECPPRRATAVVAAATVVVRAQSVWAAVEGDEAVDERKDQMALAAIVQAVPEAMVLGIAEKDSASEAWDALKEMHIGEDRVRKANMQTLKRELERMYMRDAETIGEYSLKLNTVVNKIRALGEKVEETIVVEKLLHTVLNKF